jgi:hypothetical protein
LFMPSRRALGVATLFTMTGLLVGQSASAAVLDSAKSSNNSPTVEGQALPVGGDLLGGVLGGALLGGVLGGNGLPVVGALGGVLGGNGLPVVGALGGDNGPLGGDLLGGVLGGNGVLGGALTGGALQAVDQTTLGCDAPISQLLQAFVGDPLASVCGFDPLGSGVTGLLGSL